ncbi:hypothetical protein FAM18132_01843 [Lacticaseibacillus paracasei]|nr:hypothetical protein FAM18101_01597 [Lacticaseibacillus paracasei]RND44932.1 hypothetical protein FAM18105_01411 [Lacticaseibacillus paracasei]RND71058.1 hypothetical protein FAM18132_01843 [Lacticaseibacillus paracasei]
MNESFNFTTVTKADLPLIRQMYQVAFKPIYLKDQNDQTDPFFESLVSLEEKWSRPTITYIFLDTEMFAWVCLESLSVRIGRSHVYLPC